MDFDYTEEQTLLRDSVERFVSDHYDLASRSKLVSQPPGYGEAHWKIFAELGWLALPFAEEDGGLGGTPIETMLLMEQFGRGLVVEPYLATVVMAGAALRLAGTSEQKGRLVPGIIEGGILGTAAYVEEQTRFDLSNVLTTARAEGDRWVINGRKSVVFNAETADFLVVSARTGGGQIDERGITLFLVPADADGVQRDNYQTVDGLRASELSFSDVAVSPEDVLGGVGDGYAVLHCMVDETILALAAEAVGAMDVLNKDTVEYTQQREQFGQPLSDFQVLRHRMVEMFMEFEQCRSMLYRATMAVAQHAEEAQRTVHALKFMIGRSGRFIAQNAVQLHGGMGMTEELRVGHYFKRLTVIDSVCGSADHHLAKFIDTDV